MNKLVFLVIGLICGAFLGIRFSSFTSLGLIGFAIGALTGVIISMWISGRFIKEDDD